MGSDKAWEGGGNKIWGPVLTYPWKIFSQRSCSRPRPRTQKNPRSRPSTALPRTDTFEAKDRNARGQGQGHKRKCSQKKKVIKQIFQMISKKKTVQEKFFQPIYKILTIQNVRSSSGGQGSFRGLRPRPRT